jgi:uncharacterized protein YndB with AHSA1/START domain
MTQEKTTEDIRTVTIERLYPHPPEKLWRALTDPTLLAQWLLKNDFAPTPGHTFHFRSEPAPYWDGIITCKVLTIDPPHQIAYTWSALGLESTVHFTLTPNESGTTLLMQHSGFTPDQDQAYKGATYGWQRFLTNLETTLNEGDGAA